MRGRMKHPVRYSLRYLPYPAIMLLATNLGEAWRLSEGKGNAIAVLLSEGLREAFANPLPSVHRFDLFVGLVTALLFFLIAESDHFGKEVRQDDPYGSGRWGTAEEIKPFMDKDPFQNIILTKTEGLMMETRPKDMKVARNNNVQIVGSSGAGKTYFWLEPNILQMHSSYVVTDPKGGILTDCGHALQVNGYEIRTFNTVDFAHSMHYNPLAYISKEKDILKLVTCLMANTKGEGTQAGEDFWVKAEALLYNALIGYVWYEAPEEEKNLPTVIAMIDAMIVKEDDEEYENVVDELFSELREKKPNHFAVRQYKKFKLAAGKTMKSILISCASRLAAFDIEELREIMAYDELELDKLGDRKSALFLIQSDTDSTYDFLMAMIYSQLFNVLCEKADNVYGGKLPVHVRCLIDEAANIGHIPNLHRLVATVRSREVSICLVWQAISQIKAVYKDHAETITGNMDSRIFLGGTEGSTLKELSEDLGKETIRVGTSNESYGREKSSSQGYQQTGRELKTRDELQAMDNGKCILQLRGLRPFYSDKYDPKKHPYYHLTAGADPRNTFDIKSFLHREAKLKPDEVFELMEFIE